MPGTTLCATFVVGDVHVLQVSVTRLVLLRFKLGIVAKYVLVKDDALGSPFTSQECNLTPAHRPGTIVHACAAAGAVGVGVA